MKTSCPIATSAHSRPTILAEVDAAGRNRVTQGLGQHPLARLSTPLQLFRTIRVRALVRLANLFGIIPANDEWPPAYGSLCATPAQTLTCDAQLANART